MLHDDECIDDDDDVVKEVIINYRVTRQTVWRTKNKEEDEDDNKRHKALYI